MQVKTSQTWTIGTLIDLQQKQMLRVNHEYQRGLRWNNAQKCMFIDSIFRGYSIPAFYLHLKTASVETSEQPIVSTHYDIVDGQQRIEAIYGYSEGGFALLDPLQDGDFTFPNFVKADDCPWGGKHYNELSDTLKEMLRAQAVVVYEITTDNENSIRDLFIRLQGGTPLTAQDKRDSWPGHFTEFVLKIGGKRSVEKWPGHPLFVEIAQGNESRRRQLAAQTFMLFWTLASKLKFCDIKSPNIDAFYHSQVDFNVDSPEAKRFRKVCDKLYEALRGKPRIAGHYIIHLTLFVDSLLEEYTSGWESRLAGTFHTFESRRREAADANKNRKESEFEGYYSEYGQWTQTRSDDSNTIRRRHAFFVEQLLSLLSPTKRDQQRFFTDLQRKTVYFRDMELCQYCLMNGNENKVSWKECDIHHVVPHSEGGVTSVANAALVHRECHPKDNGNVVAFREWWEGRSKAAVGEKNDDKLFPPPEGTKVKFEFKGDVHLGIIREGSLAVEGIDDKQFKSFSEASRKVTGTARNGWRDWQLCLPGAESWIGADEWRNRELLKDI